MRHARRDVDGDVATIEGMGSAAWFKDSEGNIICLDDATRGEAVSCRSLRSGGSAVAATLIRVAEVPADMSSVAVRPGSALVVSAR